MNRPKSARQPTNSDWIGTTLFFRIRSKRRMDRRLDDNRSAFVS